jgi:esterase
VLRVRAMTLAHALVLPEGGGGGQEPPKGDNPPLRWLVFLHGILGSGSNWRTFAKQIVHEMPGTAAVLVDLRLHGESLGLPPPHTIATAAEDVVELVRSLEASHPGSRIEAVLGHSFGGKVALAAAAAMKGDLAHLFVMDSTPSARPDRRGSEDTQHIVDLLQELPDSFPDRDTFLGWIQGRGVSRPTAMWLAMNVKPVPNTTTYVFRLDIQGIRALLDDYFCRDLWPAIETAPGRMRVHLIVGERSTIVDEEDRARTSRAERATLDILAGAGHWVHVDAPDELREIVLRHLRA